MWADAVVLFDPGIDDDLGLLGGVEPFRVQDFTAQSAIEPFVVAILPRRSGVDLDGL